MVYYNPPIITFKWIWLFLFQTSVGLMCILFPWYVSISLSVSLVLLVILFIKYQWWAYIILFTVPVLGRNPGLQVELEGVHNPNREPIPVFLLLSIAAFAFLWIRKSVGLHNNKIKSSIFIPIFLFLIYGLITMCWSPSDLGIGLYFTIYLVADICLLYFVFHIVDNEDSHRGLMWCLVLSGLFMSFQVFTMQFKLVTIPTIKLELTDWIDMTVLSTPLIRNQKAGWFVGPSTTAFTLGTANFFAIGLMLDEKSKAKAWFLRISVFIISMSLFLTGNKGGIWAVVMSVFLVLVLNRTLRKRFIRNSLILFLVLFLIVAMSFVLRGRKAGAPRYTTVSTTEESSIGLRLKYWKEGFYQLRKRSLTCIGLGMGGYTDLNALDIAHPHNMWFHIFFDFGFFGILIISIVIICLLRIFLSIVRYQETYFQKMSIVLFAAVFYIAAIGWVNLPYYSSTIWYLLAMFISTMNFARKELFESMSTTSNK